MMICDPLGYPRSFTYNYGMEFVETKGRMLQFFEWGHTWRTIWMDGRALPESPEPRWFGYAVGRWDGDTLLWNRTASTSEAGSIRTAIRTATRCGWSSAIGARVPTRWR